ncbi:hypothetical protein SK128_014628, partial [Halocaridina rubra]
MSNNAELTIVSFSSFQVAAIIENDRVLPQMMQTMSFTAFMPTNEAMDKYEGEKNVKLIYYHLANIPYTAQHLPDEINTQLSGNPRLYVTRLPSGKASITGWEDFNIFINNAKILQANHIAAAEDGAEQVLHIVDQVIAPTIAKAAPNTPVTAAYRNPDAQKLLKKPNLYGLVNQHSVT